jgi:hypothetical protein
MLKKNRWLKSNWYKHKLQELVENISEFKRIVGKTKYVSTALKYFQIWAIVFYIIKVIKASQTFILFLIKNQQKLFTLPNTVKTISISL